MMARDLSYKTLPELDAGLARVSAAIEAAEANGGVTQYSINGRSATIGIDVLEKWERDYVRAIDRKKGRRQALRRAVPVDIR